MINENQGYWSSCHRLVYPLSPPWVLQLFTTKSCLSCMWRVHRAEWSPCHHCHQAVLTCSHFPRPCGAHHGAEYVRSDILFAPCNNSQRGRPHFADGETEAGSHRQSLSSASLASSHNSLPSPIYFVFSHYSFPAKCYKKSSSHWRQSDISAYQMEPTHLPPRSPTWGHRRP